MAEFIVGNAFRKLARKHEFLQNLLWRLDFALIWSLVKLFGLLPIDTSSRLGSRVGTFVGPLLKRKTAIYEENFRIAFPDKTTDEIKQLAKASWGNAGRVLGEYPHLTRILNDRGGERLNIEVMEPDTNAPTPAQSTVFVSAHLCNWEVIGIAFARRGIPNATLYSPPTNPFIDRMLNESRKAFECELLPRDNSARLLIRALKGGRSVGMVMDRRVDEGKQIPFFGKDKLTTTMPAKLALKFQTDLIPVQVERLKDANFKVTFHPPIKPANPDASESDQAVDMINQVHGLFEQWIHQQPQDWFCPKRLWAKRKPKDSQKTQPVPVTERA